MKQIKYFLTTLWFLLSTTMLSAAEMSEQQAMEQARQFLLQVSNNSKAAARSQAIQNVRMTATPTGMQGLYAFNIEGGGYVIASADDRTLPVLGYSMTGTFDIDRIPCNMRAWLQGYAEQIGMLGDANVTSTTDSDSTMTAIEPLIKTHWGQDEPYNLQTPIIDNNRHAATGCSATAMAQVMYYHQWPKVATADIPAYTYTEEQTQSSVDMKGLPATTFKWDKMLTSYTKDNPGTEEQRQAVAELMRYCGQSILMRYGPASGAFIDDVATALRYYFGYSKYLCVVDKVDCTLENWKKLIWNELNQKRPVCISGSNYSDGHAFVIDGYDGNGLFHVNWGWDGESDNYFAIDVLNPYNTTSTGAPSSAKSGFTIDQKIIIGAEPSTDGKWGIQNMSNGLHLYYYPYIYKGTMYERVFYLDTENKQRTFDFALGTKNDDGTIKIIQTNERKKAFMPWEKYNIEFFLRTIKLSDGTYKLYGFYKDSEVADDTWHQIGDDMDWIGVTVKGSETSFFYDAKLKITKAYLEGDHQAPLDECTLVLEVENEGDDMFCDKITMMIGKKDGLILDTQYDTNTAVSFLKLQPKEKTTLRYPIVVPFKGDVEVRLCRPNGDYGLATTTISVDKEPHFFDLQLTDYKVVYKADEKDITEAVECTLWFKNNDTRRFDNRYIARIGNDGRENGGYEDARSASLILDPGETKEDEADIDDDLAEIKEQTDLHLVVVIKYPEIGYPKILDITIKPGTTVTPKGTTTGINSPSPSLTEAACYDLQGRRVKAPTKGVYIMNGGKVMK